MSGDPHDRSRAAAHPGRAAAEPLDTGLPAESHERPGGVTMSRRKFDRLVSEALDEIPPALTARMDNVVVQVAARNDEEPTILGLYEGIALTDRLDDYSGVLPDTIWIYRDAILEICRDADEVREEVLITVVHEIAHHFGIDDERLHALGWG